MPSTFNDNSGVVNLPLVDVPGSGIANASLQLTKDEPMEFTLLDVYFYDDDIVTAESASRLEGGLTLLDDKTFVFGDVLVQAVREEPALAPLPVVPALTTRTQVVPLKGPTILFMDCSQL